MNSVIRYSMAPVLAILIFILWCSNHPYSHHEFQYSIVGFIVLGAAIIIILAFHYGQSWTWIKTTLWMIVLIAISFVVYATVVITAYGWEFARFALYMMVYYGTTIPLFIWTIVVIIFDLDYVITWFSDLVGDII